MSRVTRRQSPETFGEGSVGARVPGVRTGLREVRRCRDIVGVHLRRVGGTRLSKDVPGDRTRSLKAGVSL